MILRYVMGQIVDGTGGHCQSECTDWLSDERRAGRGDNHARRHRGIDGNPAFILVGLKVSEKTSRPEPGGSTDPLSPS